ncbi:accessory gene regulator B family protein [Paenibacillus sp. PR3]|uniref:Putative AgrB-like protein n=1 Tax=Paenibacillus terricola TaxID=2763503 RepID=A0ABR8N268_9BACL|nr:accessory gene regulator B family protein [Paenibacillus terricola]MBD3920879.1 accessory gene regulator B family protein [Paenibacillus terricola]
MQEQQVVRMGLTETIATRCAAWLSTQNNGDRIAYLKMKLGIEMLLINLTKTLIIYGISLVCHLFLQTLIVHGAFYAIRRYAFGLHARNSVNCTLVSILMFVGTPLIGSYINLSKLTVIGLGLLFAALLYRYAPADTDKFPLIGADRRRKLRRSSAATSMILTLIAILIPSSTVTTLLMLGVALQIITILPITYKLLKRSVRNYEKYE